MSHGESLLAFNESRRKDHGGCNQNGSFFSLRSHTSIHRGLSVNETIHVADILVKSSMFADTIFEMPVSVFLEMPISESALDMTACLRVTTMN